MPRRDTTCAEKHGFHSDKPLLPLPTAWLLHILRLKVSANWHGCSNLLCASSHKKKKSLQSGGWLGGGGGGREWGGGQHNFDPGLKIIWLAHYGPCLLVIKERLGAQWPKWLQSWCVAELSRWKKTGNCKAHLPFNGHFVLVWLLSQRSGKIY